MNWRGCEPPKTVDEAFRKKRDALSSAREIYASYGIGFESRPKDHVACSEVIAHAERFRTSGLLRSHGMTYATHISHEGYVEHEQLDRYAAENGYRIAYDGLVLGLSDD